MVISSPALIARRAYNDEEKDLKSHLWAAFGPQLKNILRTEAREQLRVPVITSIDLQENGSVLLDFRMVVH